MAAPDFLRKRKNRLFTTLLILVVFAAISIYFGTLPEKTNLNFLGLQFSVEGSRSIIITVAILFGLIGGILTNIVSGDIHESIKEEEPIKEEPVKKEPEVIVPIVKIENIIQQPQESKPQPQSEPANKKFYPNSFLPDLKFFVGRREVLQKINETLAQDHRAAIHDISGLGKTFTTYKFADENQDKYDKIFFIRATKEEMLESLAKCGEMVNPQLVSVEEQKAKALGFKQWLEENEKWLVIYDNVDEPKELFHFVPVSKKGDRLFTSNFPEVTNLGTEINIVKLSHPDDEMLLYSRANNLPNKLPELKGAEKEAFDNLIREIDGLPLTLNSTGALVNKKVWTFEKFWHKYETAPKIVWESEDDYSTYQRKSAGIVFSLAYEELYNAEKTGDAVRTLLNGMSFLSPDEISEDLAQEILRKSNESFADLKDGDDLWDDVRERLTGYDLLKYNKNKCIFTTHRSIQRVIQTKLTTGEIENVCVKLSEILLNLFPKYDHFNRPACEKYSQHVQTLLENFDKFRIENKGIISLFYRLGLYHQLLGNFNNAERFYLRSSEVSGKVSGKENADYATHLNNLANVYSDQGRYDEAIEKYEEALRIDEKTIGKEDSGYATRLNNLAAVYKAQGKYDEAMEKNQEALQIREKTLGKEHTDYAQSLNNLAGVYKDKGWYDEAIEKYEEALRIDEKTIGMESPDYAIDLSNLAGVYVEQGNLKLAEDLHQRAKVIKEKTLGKLHPSTALSYWWIAVLRSKQEKYAEALPMFEEAYKQYVHFYGEGHPHTKELEQFLIICREKTK